MSSTKNSARFDAPNDNISPDSIASPLADAASAASANPELAWRQADDDVFVATSQGEFAGFVTVDRSIHVVHDRLSRRIGSYATLAAAREALVDATRPPSRSRERLRRRILSRRR